MDTAPAPRPQLAFLDGLRGLAALYVVIHHAAAEFLFSFEAGAVPQAFREWAWLFLFERYAVDGFIVLSGFCLGLPVLRHPQLRMEGGFLRFMGRRARRILPAYYGAIAFSLALDRWVPGLLLPGNRPGGGLRWDMTAPAWDTKVLLSHLALVHNAKDAWLLRIDYPLWTIATEWQIYLLFPLLVLLLRHGGTAALLIGAFGLGIWAWAGPELLVGAASPWYLGLFATGMVAAGIARSSPASPVPHYKRALALLLAEFALYKLVVFGGRAGSIAQVVQDATIGAMAAVLIIACVRESQGARQGALLALLESRPIQSLGHFAYSLYLIHAPVLAVLHIALLRWVPDVPSRMGWMLGAGIPLSLGMSWLFAQLLERPFLRARPAPTAVAVAA